MCYAFLTTESPLSPKDALHTYFVCVCVFVWCFIDMELTGMVRLARDLSCFHRPSARIKVMCCLAWIFFFFFFCLRSGAQIQLPLWQQSYLCSPSTTFREQSWGGKGEAGTKSHGDLASLHLQVTLVYSRHGSEHRMTHLNFIHIHMYSSMCIQLQAIVWHLRSASRVVPTLS